MIDYILLYQTNGKPIYSKCMGGFCKKVAFNEEQLEETLIKIANVPSFFKKGDEGMRKYNMGEVNITFQILPEYDVVLCMGLAESVDGKEEQEVIKYGQQILVQYTNIISDSKNLDDRAMENIQNYLDELITHFSHLDSTTCFAGEDCPLNVDYDKTMEVWQQIRKNYVKSSQLPNFTDSTDLN